MTASHPGVACVTACTRCAADVIPGAEEYAPGRHVGVTHIDHVGELEAAGWTVVHDMYGDPGAVDLICRHIAPDLGQ